MNLGRIRHYFYFHYNITNHKGVHISVFFKSTDFVLDIKFHIKLASSNPGDLIYKGLF